MLISDEQMQQILNLHPIECQRLIKQQINIIDNLICLTKNKYTNDKEYRNIMDQILGIIMRGNFAKLEESNND